MSTALATRPARDAAPTIRLVPTTPTTTPTPTTAPTPTPTTAPTTTRTTGATPAAARNRDPYRHLEAELVGLSAMSPDDPRRVAARNALAVALSPVCRNIAHRFVRQGEPVDDLEQVAMIGLLKALDHYQPTDYDPITAFMGYAVPTISGEIRRHLRDHTWVVHVPRRVKEIQAPLWRAVAELSAEYDRPPRPSELAARLEVDTQLVVEALGAGAARRPRSMDAPVGPGGERIADGLSYVDEALAHVDSSIELREALRLLPARNVEIIAMRFFNGMTQTQIATELGISQMHVSRLLSRSLATLRTAVAA